MKDKQGQAAAETADNDKAAAEEAQQKETDGDTSATTEEQNAAGGEQSEAPQPSDAEKQEAQSEGEAAKLQAQVDDLKDKYLRLSAEYDNYRKRAMKEKADLLKTAGEDKLKGLLPVIDDFERALQHMGEAQDVESLRKGVELIHKKFMDFMAKNGVTEITAKGEPFDESRHEAISMMAAPEEALKGKVFDCVEKGYMLGDKVMRYAKVVVCQ